MPIQKQSILQRANFQSKDLDSKENLRKGNSGSLPSLTSQVDYLLNKTDPRWKSTDWKSEHSPTDSYSTLRNVLIDLLQDESDFKFPKEFLDLVLNNEFE